MIYFSIIIPLFNKENYIENTLKSVLNQTHTNYEIIIINDGSNDESESKVLKFKDSRIRLYSQKNQGVSVARNLGIEKSRYDYIAFLDADDLWMENHLETLNTLIYDFPNAGIYASRYQLIFNKGKTSIPKFNGISDDFYGIVHNYFDVSLNYAVATASSIAVPKYVFEKIGNFKSKISSGQDVDMWIRIALKYPIAISSKITASYLHYVKKSLSKTPVLEKKLNDFLDYKSAEKANPSLKKYLDIYRMEYALQYKIAGANKQSKKLYDEILKANLSLKVKIIYHLPQWIAILLLKIKRLLRKNGIDFSIYQ